LEAVDVFHITILVVYTAVLASRGKLFLIVGHVGVDAVIITIIRCQSFGSAAAGRVSSGGGDRNCKKR
jgi:hypothetical protein